MNRFFLHYATVLLLLGLTISARANTRYVDSTATGANNGTSWANAYTSLADAVIAADSTPAIDTILVAKGTYFPQYASDGLSTDVRDWAFVFTRDGLTVLGGYPSGGGVRNHINNPTILSGDIGVLDDYNDNVYHVVIAAGAAVMPLNSSLTIDGFTIKHGFSAGSNVTINSQDINGGIGGGMYNVYSSASVTNCTFISNLGGSMYNEYSSSNITSCIFSEGIAFGIGGLINRNAPVVVTNCIFSGNYAAIGNEDCDPYIRNCTMSGNGAFAIINNNASPNISNSIIFGNEEGITNNGSSNPVITYSLVQDSSSTANGNLDGVTTNPMFVNAPSFTTAPFTNGNYRLLSGSSCKNAGNNDSVSSGITTDIAGSPRILAGTVDMGAYEANVYTWTGNVSADWNNAANWDENSIPVASSYAILPSGTPHAPDLNNTSTTVAYFTQHSGQALALGTGTLTVTNNFTNNGIINGSGKIILSGSSAQDISGNGTISNLEINNSNGVSIRNSIGDSLQITGLLSLTVGTLTTNDRLVLKSTSPTFTAMVGPVSGSIAGNVTHERYHDAPTGGQATQRAWRLITTPLKGATANSVYDNWQNAGTINNGTGIEMWAPSGGTGILTGGGAGSIRKYLAASNSYQNITNTVAEPLFDANINYPFLVFVTGGYGSGYISSGGTATVAKAYGSLITGTQTYNYGTLAAGKLQLVANPYACPVDFEEIYANSGTQNIAPQFWTLDPHLNEVGGYVLVQRTGENSYTTVPVSGSTQNQYIQNGQAFFIQSDAAGNTSLEIEEDDKNTSDPQTTVFRTNSGSFETMAINLKAVNANNTTHLIDGALVNCHNNYTTAILKSEDASKFSNPNESISVLNGANRLALEGRPLLDNGDTITIAFSGMRQRNYELELVPGNIVAPGLTATLYDNFLNTSAPVSLTSNTFYPFAVTSNSASSATGRFRIAITGSTPLDLKFIQLTAKKDENNNVQIKWMVNNQEGIHTYELERSRDAKEFERIGALSADNNDTYNYTDKQPGNGTNYYRVKAIARKTSSVYSNIVSANTNKTGTQLSSFPNPAKGDQLQISINDLTKGVYYICLYNTAGQKLIVQSFNYNGSNNRSTLDISQLATSTYLLQLTNENGETLAEQKIVKQ